jgi:hypothetical protein
VFINRNLLLKEIQIVSKEPEGKEVNSAWLRKKGLYTDSRILL